jgi:hypothetical protein
MSDMSREHLLEKRRGTYTDNAAIIFAISDVWDIAMARHQKRGGPMSSPGGQI